jgi:Sugar-transfer associated ATP-grasp
MKRLYELMQLRRPPNRLTPSEYDLYRLADLSWEEKSRYLGARAINAMASANDRRSDVLTRDKLVSYALLRSHGIPFPTVRAVAHPTRGFPGARSLPSVDAMAAWLESEAEFPVFVKPNAGNGGFGSVIADGYADRQLHLRDGSTREIGAYFDRWLFRAGLVFQAVAKPHPDIAAAIGPRLATARIFVPMLDTGPMIHRAALRIPVGTSMVDNFQHGASGNLLGAVDIERGVLSTVVGKRGDRLQTIPAHPDTGRPIIGMTVPDWDAAKRLCLDAAPLFPGVRLQSWDIGFTDEGPQVIELNNAGDFDVLQLAEGRGIADAVWWRLCREPNGSLWRRWLVRKGPWRR